ncbi:MAG: hypothetical protein HWQ41_14020 [Nostoc sp. NOS(2021)]|uniref:hypothetical protein n=1 Tax=Nostoc sp. NOS(2021) TaxID=2815407 RepID=UPI0025D73B91|nr:hypothetical protein [Nostoc sp. NOS(2021)]MBN3896334.1 hypothetical protein [Nostoc sp. NOS(2021)]
MEQAIVQLQIPFSVLVEAIKALQLDDKLALKQILDENIVQVSPVPQQLTNGEKTWELLDNSSSKDSEKKRQVMERFTKAVEQVLAETGMTEDELAGIFDMSKPFPYDAIGR